MPDQKPIVPLIIRGEVITDHLVEIPVRGNDLVFDTPDVHHYADRIPLGHPGKMADLYQISFEDILDFLQELGGRLDIATNAYLQEACSLSYKASPMAPSLVDTFYANMDQQFNREFLRNMADSDIGIDKLEGWGGRTDERRWKHKGSLFRGAHPAYHCRKRTYRDGSCIDLERPESR